MVFTTARLFVAEGDIAEAELTTGNIDKEKCSLKPVNWLVYHYPQSSRLQHSVDVKAESDWDRQELAGILYQEYVRPIAVVSVQGIVEFLAWHQWEMFIRICEFRR